MQTLIFIIIAIAIDQLVKRAKAKKESEEFKDLSENPTDESSPPQNPTFSPSRKLQEYIKQFEEAQREAAQGTMEPATPPSIPEDPRHNVGNNVTLREVAEEVILMDTIDIEYLMDEFEMSEGTAISMLAELQRLRIVGHDMGDGECDVLVHDELELSNLLSRELNDAREEDSQITATTPSSSEKQSQLKILEERARKAREEANKASRQSDITNGYVSEIAEGSELTQRRVFRSINKESVRRGFIWGKIIDEPRFKKRWSPAQR